MQKLLFLSLVLSLLLSAKPYDQTRENSRNIKVKIKKKFQIPKKIDHKNILKEKNRRLKKIKKDRGSIVQAN